MPSAPNEGAIGMFSGGGGVPSSIPFGGIWVSGVFSPRNHPNHFSMRRFAPTLTFPLSEAFFCSLNQFSRKLARLVTVGRIPSKSRLRRGVRDSRCSRSASEKSSSVSSSGSEVSGSVATLPPKSVPELRFSRLSRVRLTS